MSSNESDIHSVYDLDKQEFELKSYMGRIYRESSITNLMSKENMICKEISSIEGERNALCYNNFIKVSELHLKFDLVKIEEMIEGVSAKMTDVKKAYDDISPVFNSNKKLMLELKSKRKKLEQISREVNSVAELKDLANHERYPNAVALYFSVKSDYSKVKLQRSDELMLSEMESTMKQLKGNLTAKLKTPNVDITDLLESIGLLKQMKEPTSSICLYFLRGARKQQKIHFLQTFRNRDQQKPRTSTDFLTFYESVLTKLTRQMDLYKKLFLENSTSENSDTDLMKPLTHFVKSMIKIFLDVIPSNLLIMDDEKMDTSCICTLHSVYQQALDVHSTVPDLLLKDKIAHVIMMTLKSKFEDSFFAFETHLKEIFKYVLLNGTNFCVDSLFVNSFVEDLEKSVMVAFKLFILNLMAFIDLFRDCPIALCLENKVFSRALKLFAGYIAEIPVTISEDCFLPNSTLFFYHVMSEFCVKIHSDFLVNLMEFLEKITPRESFETLKANLPYLESEVEGKFSQTAEVCKTLFEKTKSEESEFRTNNPQDQLLAVEK